jgi:hypothetical protein
LFEVQRFLFRIHAVLRGGDVGLRFFDSPDSLILGGRGLGLSALSVAQLTRSHSSGQERVRGRTW